MNLLKTCVQAEIEIRMIDAYVALIGEKAEKKHHLYTNLHVLVSLNLQNNQTKVQRPH